MKNEIWNIHSNKQISQTQAQQPYRQHGQNDAPGILRSVRISGNDLEYFILEDDDTNKTSAFLTQNPSLDFDCASLRIPKGFRNVKYNLTNNGLIATVGDFDLAPQDAPLDIGFFGTVLIHLRDAGKDVPPFVKKDGTFHHCDASPQTKGRDCPTFINYGFGSALSNARTNFGKIKIFFSMGPKRL